MAPVQRSADRPDAGREPAVPEIAASGVAGGGGALPYAETVQRLFGRHDISGVKAHVGGPAETANRAIGAEAYATGNHVAFAGTPSLRTAAHEAAHVVQQRGGVQLKGGVGESGDEYERHADQVADAVVQGKRAEGLLDQHAGTGARGAPSAAVQREAQPHATPAPATAPPPPKTNVSAVDSAAPPTDLKTTAAAKPGEQAPTDTTITDTPRVESVEMLHAEEMFAEVPANTVAKKHVFDRLNKAVHAESRAEKARAAAKKPEAVAKADAALAAAKQRWARRGRRSGRSSQNHCSRPTRSF
jgi:hypothetical protein